MIIIWLRQQVESLGPWPTAASCQCDLFGAANGMIIPFMSIAPLVDARPNSNLTCCVMSFSFVTFCQTGGTGYHSFDLSKEVVEEVLAYGG